MAISMLDSGTWKHVALNNTFRLQIALFLDLTFVGLTMDGAF